VGHQVFDLIKGLKEAHFDRTILLGIGQRATVIDGPGSQNSFRKENTDRERRLAVGGYIENVFRGRLQSRLRGNLAMPTK